MDKIKSIIVSPVPPRYIVSQIGYLQVNAQDKLLIIYDDKGNRKVVSAADSSITSSVINNLIDNKLKNIQVLKYKGSIKKYSDLPDATITQIGDVYHVEQTKKEYICNGKQWIQLGFDFDLTKIYETIAITSGALKDTKADKAYTLSGYNIQDAYTKIETQNLINNTSSFLNNIKADKADTLAGYNIQNAYTKTETQDLINNTSSVLNNTKANNASTLFGYNIQDAYTKDYINNNYYTSAQIEAKNYLTKQTDPIFTAISSKFLTQHQPLSGYYTKLETDNLLSAKANNANTLVGYNIQDAYTKIETQNLINNTSSILNINKAENSDVQYMSSVIGDSSILGNDTLISTLQYVGYNLANEINERQQINKQLSSVITGKVDKLSGYSLMKDSEITRLASVDNYNDTTVKNNINTISGTYLKNININGTPATVSNNIAAANIRTCNSFPSTFITGMKQEESNVTTEQFCQSIKNTTEATVGMVYLGQVKLIDMPFDGWAEVIVRIMSETKVIVLEMFSTDVRCNHWYAMYYGSMQTGTSMCPWQGIMSIPISKIGTTFDGEYDPNITTLSQYAPRNDNQYHAASKKYVDQQISAKLTTTNATVTNVQEIVSSYISSYVKTEVDPKFTTISGQFVTKTELPGLISSLISGYVNELKETKALALALSSILVENDTTNAAKIQQQIDNSLQLTYQTFDDLL